MRPTETEGNLSTAQGASVPVTDQAIESYLQNRFA